MKHSNVIFLSGAMAMLVLWLPASALADTATPGNANPESAETRIAQTESMCASRAQATAETGPHGSLFARLGGEARIHVITREMVRLHQQNPSLSSIVRKYNPDYLADMLARYLITATGGPTRYQGPPLHETHAHLQLSNAQWLAGGTDFAEAMHNIGATEADIVDTSCLLGALRSQIVRQ
jgi:hemoglobin